MDIPHIDLKENEQGSVSIKISDHELFDYIDDYLTEQCGIEISTVRFPETDISDGYTIELPNAVTLKAIKTILSKLDPSEINRIYKINN